MRGEAGPAVKLEYSLESEELLKNYYKQEVRVNLTKISPGPSSSRSVSSKGRSTSQC